MTFLTAVTFSGGKQVSETCCTLLDIQIDIFELRDSARFISSINRVRTRIPAFFSNRRKRAFCLVLL